MVVVQFNHVYEELEDEFRGEMEKRGGKFLRRPSRFYAKLQLSPILGRAVPTSQFVGPSPLPSG